MLTRKRLRAVLFDWDGTLLNSFQADANAYAECRALAIRWAPERLSSITPTGITSIGPCDAG